MTKLLEDIVVELPDEDTTDNQGIETVETTEEPSDTEVPEEEVVEEDSSGRGIRNCRRIQD